MSVAFDLEREQERIDALGRAVEEKINQAFKEKLFGEGKLFGGSFESLKITVVPPKVYSNQYAPHAEDVLTEGMPPAFQITSDARNYKSNALNYKQLKNLLSSIGAEDILIYEGHGDSMFGNVRLRLGIADAERIAQHDVKHLGHVPETEGNLPVDLLTEEINAMFESVAPNAFLSVTYASKERNVEQANFDGYQIHAHGLPRGADIGKIVNKLAQLAGCSPIDRTLGIVSKSNSRLEADNTVRVSDAIIQKMLAAMGTQQEPGPQREQMTSAITSMLQEKSRAVA